jgi:hypothetical protein
MDWNARILSVDNISQSGSFLPLLSSRKQLEGIEYRSNSRSLTPNNFNPFQNLYKQDIVSINGAANDGSSTGARVKYNLPWALIVGGSNANDEWAGSNIGEGLDIVAPASAFMIASAFAQLGGNIPTDPSLVVLGEQDLWSWTYISTSNAGPIVNGAVSLMLGYAREKLNKKYFSNEDIMNILRLSADKVYDKQSVNSPYTLKKAGGIPIVSRYDYKVGGSARTAYLQDGWDEYMGHGRLNVCKAMWYQRDGFLQHYTTPYNEKLSSMPVTIFGLTSDPISLFQIDDQASIAVTPSTFAIMNYTDFTVRQIKVQKTISFSELSPVPSTTTTIKVWGGGSKMAGNGFANFGKAIIQGPNGDEVKSVLYDAGWCQPTSGTVTNSGAILETFVYQLINAKNKTTNTIETL